MSYLGRPATTATAAVREARDFLFEHAADYDGAVQGFRWPELTEFNFALEWFDVIAGEHPLPAAVRPHEDVRIPEVVPEAGQRRTAVDHRGRRAGGDAVEGDGGHLPFLRRLPVVLAVGMKHPKTATRPGWSLSSRGVLYGSKR